MTVVAVLLFTPSLVQMLFSFFYYMYRWVFLACGVFHCDKRMTKEQRQQREQEDELTPQIPDQVV